MDDHEAWLAAYCVGSIRVVKLNGELDLAVAGPLRQQLLAEVGRRPECLVVDLTEVSFLDCSALGALLAGNHRAKTVGVGFALSGLSGIPARVLALSGTTEEFSSYPDVSAAVTANDGPQGSD